MNVETTTDQQTIEQLAHAFRAPSSAEIDVLRGRLWTELPT